MLERVMIIIIIMLQQCLFVLGRDHDSSQRTVRTTAAYESTLLNTHALSFAWLANKAFALQLGPRLHSSSSSCDQSTSEEQGAPNCPEESPCRRALAPGGH